MTRADRTLFGDLGNLVIGLAVALAGSLLFAYVSAGVGSPLHVGIGTTVVVAALTALLGTPTCGLVHELGHAGAVKHYGWPLRAVVVGEPGGRGLTTAVRGIRVTVNRLSIGGHTDFGVPADATVGQYRAVTLSGLLANALVASSSAALAWLCPPLLALSLAGIATINALVALGNLQPVVPTPGQHASDGWQLAELRGAPSSQLLSELHKPEHSVPRLLRRLRNYPDLHPLHRRATRGQLAHALSLLGRFQDAIPVYAALLGDSLPDDLRAPVAASWADAVLSAAIMSGQVPSPQDRVLCRERLALADGHGGVRHTRAMLELVEGRHAEAVLHCEQTLAEEQLGVWERGLVDATLALAHAQAGDLGLAAACAAQVPATCPFADAVERAMSRGRWSVAD
jgi:hypothetical protein